MSKQSENAKAITQSLTASPVKLAVQAPRAKGNPQNWTSEEKKRANRVPGAFGRGVRPDARDKFWNTLGKKVMNNPTTTGHYV